MKNGNTILYGNEWIKDGGAYYKVKVTQDGIYSVDLQTLRQAGFQGTVSGSQIHLYHNGREVPLRVSTSGAWDDTDYFIFRGYKAKSELDTYLFPQGAADISNPAASIYSDTAAYYIYINPIASGVRTKTIINDTTAAPPLETNIYAESILSFQSKVMDMYDYLSSSAGDFALEVSQFIPGKGMVNATANQTINFTLNNIDTHSPLGADFQYRGTTNIGNYGINLGHNNKVRLNGLLIDSIYSSTAQQIFVSKYFTDNNHTLQASNKLEFQPGHNKDFFYAGYIRIKYPRTLELNSKTAIDFYTVQSGEDAYLVFHQNAGSFTNPYLTDSLGNWQITGIRVGDNVVFRLPDTLTNTKITLTSDELITPLQSAERRILYRLDGWPSDFTMIVSDKLINSPGSSVLDKYLSYRSSTAGGSYLSNKISVEELYDCFAYGQTYNPLAIKNFINFKHQHSTEQQFYLLVGKAFPYNEVRLSNDLQTAITNGFTLPTMGDLGSDNMIASASFDHLDMVASIGRLPFKTNDQIQIYLNKLKARDQAFITGNTSEDNAWMKKIVFVNGGTPGGTDQSSIGSFQNSTANIISRNKFSAYISSYKKSTTDPIGPIVDEFFNNINQGAAIVDYFGHGSIIDLAIQLERPNQYNNATKFPILIIRGCNAGNIHAVQECVSERVLIGTDFSDKGYIAVIGSAGKSTIGQLGVLGQDFYNLLGGDLYGKTIGEMMQRSFSNPNVNTSKEAYQQVYTGDPAISFPALQGPDYRVDPKSLQLNPGIVSTQDKEFTISFNIENLGSNSVVDSLDYAVYYADPSGTVIDSVISKIKYPGTISPVSVRFALAQNPGGNNTVFIEVDPFNKIAENILPHAETNNEYLDAQGNKGFSFFVKSSQIQIVYPPLFSIVDTSRISLYAFSGELDDNLYTYHWKIDTTDLFNSPSRFTTSTQSRAGHLVLTPDINFIPNVAYYWKVERDSISPDRPYNSATGNFTIIPGGEGFIQHHNGQYRLNTNNYMVANGGGNYLKFGKRDLDFSYTNGLTTSENINYLGGSREGVFLQSMKANDHLGKIAAKGLIVMWYRMDSMFVSFPTGFQGYGSSIISNNRGFNFLYFKPESRESRISLVNFLEDIVGSNDAFFFATVNKKDSLDIDIQDWAADSIYNNGRNIFNTLEKYGAIHARELGIKGLPYTILADKKEGVLAEKISNNYEEHSISHTFLTNSDFGSIEQVFGPSSKWDKIEILQGPVNRMVDTLTATIEALHFNDPSKNIIKNYGFKNENDTMKIDLSWLDPVLYPKLKVNLYFQDPFLYRGKFDSLAYLKIYSKELPEAAIVTGNTSINSDTLQRGQKLSLHLQSANISRYDMDSMLVSYTLRYHNNNSWVEEKRYDSLRTNQTGNYTLDLDTQPFDGPAQLVVDLNPNGDQPEQTHLNNIWSRNLFIHNDNENPNLDVTFDGEHIFDGDIVSPKPLIKINVKDENKYFALQDSSLLELILTLPNDSISHISIADPHITFYPADPDKLAQQNQATIEYRPNFLQEGDYKLEVNAKDVSGNKAGINDYSRTFKVILKESVSKLFNYPNPFSNATRFVYTLTGDELPVYYKIQIMSVSGKIVREITQNELGPLKIGKHLTDFVWDGTDQYGDKLANGVYLYRFIMKDQSKKRYDEYELSNNNKSFFDGDWGKLVIIR